ncbi:hypothetical protein [Emticicia agri]|uniref:Uncharacterized protein n=1 Tax=Emticicia agri TaxID=2492393 RepID=A0A4Q5LW30_9BACT|nr:hypothetical protein [Emticicia agri]RYU93747.1 hypothetical protein EWM59_20270 [Emticicia agri]
MVVIFVVTIISISCLTIGIYSLKVKVFSNVEPQEGAASQKIFLDSKVALRLVELGVGLIVIGGLFILYSLLMNTGIATGETIESLDVHQKIADANLINKKREFLTAAIILFINGVIILMIANRIFLNSENIPQSLPHKNKEFTKASREEQLFLAPEVLLESNTFS